jgi:integrase
MATLRPNHRHVLAAKPIGGRRTRFSIDGVRGLMLDVTPAGSRTWYVRYQVRNGLSRVFRYYRIGDASSVSLAQAIRRAREVRSALELEGVDLYAVERIKPEQPTTFGTLFDGWYERHALPRLARPLDDKRNYENHLARPLGSRRVEDIKRTDLAVLRDRIAARSGPIISNHIVALFNRVMNWAVEEGLIASNPGTRLRKVGEERPRERVLSDNEIRRFWQALTAMDNMTGEHIARGETGRMLSPATRAVLRLMLLTGQRRGELVDARKSELDLASGSPLWTIPGARTKNGLLHRLPLAPLAADESAKAVALSPPSSPLVFPSPTASYEPILASAVTRAMNRLVAELGMESASPHDLRRTVGTRLASLGFPVNIRALVLNHRPAYFCVSAWFWEPPAGVVSGWFCDLPFGVVRGVFWLIGFVSLLSEPSSRRFDHQRVSFHCRASHGGRARTPSGLRDHHRAAA